MTLKERFAFVFLWSVICSICFAAAAFALLIALAVFDLFLDGMSLILGVTSMECLNGALGIFVGIVCLLALFQILDWANNVNEARLKRQKGESNEA